MEINDGIQHRGELSPHRYCVGCGLVKVEGDGRGRSAGYYISLVSALSAHLAHNRIGKKLTKIDVRLICQEIRGNELFSDPYGSRQAAQERAFIEVVMGRRGDLNVKVVREFMAGYESPTDRGFHPRKHLFPADGVVRKKKRPRST